MTKKVIFDCDNTMGIKGCDVDDGLALLYLLGKKNIEVFGITTTYGNSSINTVYNNTRTMLEDIGRTDLRVFKGCPDKVTPFSEAVDFLVQSVNSFKGEISILATGSLTNIFAAYLRDNTFFEKISQLVIMGGITENLMINGRILNELNMSCDPIASKWVLKKGKKVEVLTGNSCLDAFFTREEFVDRLQNSKQPSVGYIKEKCLHWFEKMMFDFQIDGFYNWDVVAAAYLAEPELFRDNHRAIKLDEKNLEKGLLSNDSNQEMSYVINTPQIGDKKGFVEDVYQSWFNAKVSIK